MREENSLGRVSVPEQIVLSAVQEHEEGICSGLYHSKKEATSIVEIIHL